jgi:O-antigen ligase
MKKYIEVFVNKIKTEPLIVSIGMCVLLLSVMGTSVRHVSSTMFVILILLSFSVVTSWKATYLSLSRVEKMFLFSLIVYMLSGLVSVYNVDDLDKYYKLFERYLRFALIIPVYLLIIRKNTSILNYLLFGAVISGPFMFVVALGHYLLYPDVPAKGYYHHIIFGQLAMLNVGIMLTALLTKKLTRRTQSLILLSMFCGIVTAVLSESRGVWAVFPVYILIAIVYVLKKKHISVMTITVPLVLLVLISSLTPISDVIERRFDEAATEVDRYYEEDRYVTSVGTRLAMWDIAIDVWKRHPILGTGPGDFDDEVMALQRSGDYRGMPVHNSTHNIYIQAMVGSGLFGLLALIFMLLIAPLRLLFNRLYTSDEGRLAGIVTIATFTIYGLSESWTLRLPTISIFLVYMVVAVSHLRIVGSRNSD